MSRHTSMSRRTGWHSALPAGRGLLKIPNIPVLQRPFVGDLAVTVVGMEELLSALFVVGELCGVLVVSSPVRPAHTVATRSIWWQEGRCQQPADLVAGQRDHPVRR